MLTPMVICLCPWAVYMYKITQSLNDFSETALPVFSRFHMEPSVEEVLSVYSNGSAPLNKLATMPICGKKHLKIHLFLYGKNVEKLLSQNVLKTNA